MFNFIIKAVHENGTKIEMVTIADSFTAAFKKVPVDKCVTLTVVRSPICH